MLSPIALLPLLFYINPNIGLTPDLITKNCFAFNSGCNIISSNRVYHTSVPSDDEVQTILSFFGQIPFTWAVDSADTASIAVLEKQLLRVISLPAMALDLQTTTDLVYKDGIAVQEIDINSLAIEQWVAIVIQGFTFASKEELLKLMQSFKKRISSGLKLYLGSYQGQVVAASMIILHGDIATLHWVSTAPEARGRGLGFAVSHKALLDAKKSGCRTAVLLSSELGNSVYKKLGFKEYALYHLYSNKN